MSIWLPVCALLLVGCASLPNVTDQDNPADPRAAESPISSVGGLPDANREMPSSPEDGGDKSPPDDSAMKDMPRMKMGTMSTLPATKTIYTCPMHPEVHEDHPGKCPKCGMTLVVEKSGKR